MPNNASQSALRPRIRQCQQVLRELGTVPAVAAPFAAGIESLRQQLAEAIVAEIPAFSATGNPDVLPELKAHSDEHIEEIRRLMSGGTVGQFDFVAQHAVRRAAQKFPLEATLHAYRCGHKVLLQSLRNAVHNVGGDSVTEAISAIADFAIEYTDTISIIATSAYVEQTRALADAESDRRNELMNVLLSGYDEADGRVARMLRRAGYLAQRQAFCVAALQSVDPAEMENPARANRLLEAVSGVAADVPGRALLGIRDNVVIAVFSDTRRLSGWTVPQTTLARQVEPALLRIGPAALTGVSSDAPSTSGIPKALEEARMALDFASVGNRVVPFADIGLRRLLLRAARDNVQAALPAWIDRFEKADKRSRNALTATVRAYADCDMNVLKAAKALAVHPNTIYSRVERIKDATGLNALTFHDLSELLLGIDCRRS